MRSNNPVHMNPLGFAFLCLLIVTGFVGSACKEKGKTPARALPTRSAPAPRTKGNTAPSCLVTRAAFDVGSGSTKMKVAVVDTCQKRVVKLLFPTKKGEYALAVEKVPYKKDLARSFKAKKRKPGYLSQRVLGTGVAALKKLKAQAVRLGASGFVGVATSAFRQAKNGAAILDKLSQLSGVKVHLISQRTEGLLAFYAVRAKFPAIPFQKLLVWDIGGSSMQMIAQTVEDGDKDKFDLYLGHLASVPMARHIMFKLQGKKQAPGVSPNPISTKHAKMAADYVAKRGGTELSALIKKRAKVGVVYGVGGVHFFSVQGQVKPGARAYTLAQLQSAIRLRLNKNSRQLARLNRPKAPKKAMRFIDTQLTNLILVAGFMEALGVEEVKTASINLASGLFLALKYWRK